MSVGLSVRAALSHTNQNEISLELTKEPTKFSTQVSIRNLPIQILDTARYSVTLDRESGINGCTGAPGNFRVIN